MANEFKVRKGLIVNGSGSTILDVQGSQGQLFSVTDSLTGSLFAVNDISGIPVLEAFSDTTVKIGQYNAEAIIVSGSNARVTGSLLGTASWANNATTASRALQANTASYVQLAASASYALSASNAATASVVLGSAASAGTVTGTSGQLLTKDDRIIEPNSITSGYMQFGFTSFANNNSSPYADYIHLRSYTDGTGGSDNLLMFLKSGFGIRTWQQTWNSATAYASYRDVALISGSNTGYIPFWTQTNQLLDSVLYFNGTNIGIGTTSPSQRLHIHSGSAFIVGGLAASAIQAYTSSGRLIFNDDFNDVARGPNKITLWGNGSVPYGIGIHSNTTAYYSGQDHRFYRMTGTDTSTITHLMVISGSGNVGIGTTTPSHTLQVSGTPTTGSNPQLSIFNPNNSAFQVSGLRLSTAAWDVQLRTVQNADWLQLASSTGIIQHAWFDRRFYPGSGSNNGVNTGYISGDGTNIGIGITTPTGSKLHVNGNVWATSFTGSLLGTATTASYVLQAVSSSFATQAANASSASFATSAANATTASFATFANTASSADNFNVRNTLTVTTIVAQVITSSQDFVTGSTRFGTIITNTHQFTGSVSISGSLNVTGNGITGSLLGTATTASYVLNAISSSFATQAANSTTASFILNAVSSSFATNAANATTASYILNAASASFASTASFVNTLNQSVIITGSLTVGQTTLGSGENTLVLGLPPNGGAGEGGQILLAASGGLFTSASMLDNYQNRFRVLRGSNAGSDAEIANFNMHTGLIQFNRYTGSGAFVGTVAAFLAVDSNGNILTSTGSAGGGGAAFPFTGSAQITGSLGVTGSITATSLTGSLLGTATTASYVLNAVSASFATNAANATSASYALTASYATASSVAISASFTTQAANASSASFATSAASATSASIATNAVTASFVLNAVSASFATNAANATTASFATFANTASSADNFNVRNTLTVQTIIAQVITSSQNFVTGSTKFGTIITNTHQFTGSVSISGSLNVVGNGITGSLLGTAATASYVLNAISSSFATSAANATTASFVLQAVSASFATQAANATTASYILNAVSASFATSAASATSASIAANTVTASHALNAVTASFATNAANAFVQNGNSFGAAALLGTNDAQNLQFETNGTVRMTVSSSGNVGIGTTSPVATLALVGSGSAGTYSGVLRVVNSSTDKWGSITLPDDQSTQTTANNYYLIGRGISLATRVMSFHIPATSDYGSGTQPFFGWYSTGADLLASIQASTGNAYFKGNVGINTTAPSQRLHIHSGSAFIVGGLSGNATQAYTASGRLIFNNDFTDIARGPNKVTLYDETAWKGGFGIHLATVGYYSGQDHRFYRMLGTDVSTITHLMVVSGSGNVGINMTTPSGSTLTVNGNVWATSFTGSLLGTATTASYVLNAISSSFATQAANSTTASFALTASTVLGSITSASYSATASVLLGSITSASYAATASVVLGSITSASFASTSSFTFQAANASSASFATSAANATTASFATFATSASYAATSSFSRNLTVGNTFVLDATLTDYASIAASSVGSNNLFTQNTSSYTSAFFKYTCASASFASRAGEVIAVWNGTSVQFTDFSTVDVGNTGPVTASVAIVTGQVQFNIQTNTSGWTIKSMATFI